MDKAGLSAEERPRLSLAARIGADRLVRNNAIYLAGSVLVGAVAYVFHFAAGRLLGPEQYAIVAAMVSALSLLSLPTLVLQTTAARFSSLLFARGDLGAIVRFLVRLSLVSLVAIAVVAAGLALLAPAAASYLRLADTRYVYLLIAASVFALLVSIPRGAIQGLSRFVLLSLNTLIDMTTRLVVSIALILAGLGALGAAIAIACGPFIAYVQSLFVFRRFAAPRSTATPGLSDVGAYTASAIVAAAGITYLLNADVLLSKHFLPAQQSGLYAAGAVLGRVIYFLGTTVAAVMFPEVTLRHARGEAHFHVVERSLLFLGLMSSAFVLAYVLLPGLVIGPFGKGFAGVRPYLGLFAVALSFFALSVLLVNYFLSINRRRFIGPLVGACVLETILITVFHSGPRQVVLMVLLSMAALFSMLGVLYVADRLNLGH